MRLRSQKLQQKEKRNKIKKNLIKKSNGKERYILMEDYKKQFHIRYIILKFMVRMVKDCVLPAEKASAIRGGFGNCLLELQCISDIKPEPCGDCTFRQACIVQNIMYAPPKIPVSFIQEKGSEGYSIHCLDKRTEFYKGDKFSFSVTLFGDIIVYLQPILQAFLAKA